MATRLTLAVALFALLTACGGDDGDDPASRTFTYGASAAPSYDEQLAADDGSFLLGDGATCRSAGDAVATESASGSLPMLPDDMAAYAFQEAGFALAPLDTATKRVAAVVAPRAFQGAALGEGFDNPECVTATPGAVTYRRCVLTAPDAGTTMVMTIDGTFTWAADVFAWDATIGMSMSDVEIDMRGTNHLYGSLTFGPSTIAGRARSDMDMTASNGAMSMRMGMTTIADLDLDYAADPFCVTGGTLELRRIWTRRPAGMPAEGEYADQGVKFEWQGCGEVLVSRSL